MGKRFKLRISRVISSFNTCCSKDPLALPSNPVPLSIRFSPVNLRQDHHPIKLHYPPHRPQPPSSSAASTVISFACGCRSRSRTECATESQGIDSPEAPTPEFQWEKQDRFHVVAAAKILDHYESPPRQKIYNSSASDGDAKNVLLPALASPLTGKKKQRRPRKSKNRKMPLTSSTKTRMGSSSGGDSEFLFSSYDEGYDVDNDGDGLQELDHRDDYEGETETLVTSSRTLSTDECSPSELFNPQLQNVRERRAITTKKLKMKKKSKQSVSWTTSKENNSNISSTNVTGNGLCLSSHDEVEIDTPARLSMFLKRLMPCAIEGKVRDSFAVVKKSEDPFEDFKESMLEMILEKEMFEEKDLEQLLQCFLSLNSRQHHAAIVNAFYEIWETLFLRRSTSFCSSVSTSDQ